MGLVGVPEFYLREVDLRSTSYGDWKTDRLINACEFKGRILGIVQLHDEGFVSDEWVVTRLKEIVQEADAREKVAQNGEGK